MTRPRKGSRAEAAHRVATLAHGGLEAIRVAEELVRNDDQIQVRVSAARKRIYGDAAKAAGLTLSAWILAQLDEAVAK